MVGHPAFSYLCSCLWKPCTDNFHFHPVTKKNFITACRLQMRSCCRCEGRSHSVSEWHICKWVSLAWMCVVNFFFMEHYFLAQLLENMDRIFDIRGIIAPPRSTFWVVRHLSKFWLTFRSFKRDFKGPYGTVWGPGSPDFFQFLSEFPTFDTLGAGGKGGSTDPYIGKSEVEYWIGCLELIMKFSTRPC